MSSSRIISAMRPARSRAAPSNTTKRQGASLPWSGTRDARLRIVSSSSAVGPGPVISAGGAERRRLSRSIVSFIRGFLGGRFAGALLHPARRTTAFDPPHWSGTRRLRRASAGESGRHAGDRTNLCNADGAGAAWPLGAARADPATADGQATLSLSAVLNGETAPMSDGVRWRVFSAKTEEDGSHALVVESNLAEPTLTLAPGDYVVHAAFGLASAAKRLTLGPEVRAERLSIAAGGLKIGGVLGDQPIDPAKLSLAIYVPVGRNPEGKLVDAKAKAGDIVALPEGAYHIVSTYLDTVGGRFLAAVAAPSGGKSTAPAPSTTLPSNSIVSADIKVTSGKLTDVTLRHRCATQTLKLVNKPGAEALANTTFTVLTPGGDVIRELDGRVSVAGAGRRRICGHRPARRQNLSIDLRGPDRCGPRRRSRCTRDRPGEWAGSWPNAGPGCARGRRQGRGLSGCRPFSFRSNARLAAPTRSRARWPKSEIASEIYSIAGDFDILAKFYVERDVDIGHFVGQKVQTIPGIVDTRTIITFKAF